MLELENQLEAIATPPPEPVIPGPEEEDAEEIQGESGIESRPTSPLRSSARNIQTVGSKPRLACCLVGVRVLIV
jgi:hypothetical protein